MQFNKYNITYNKSCRGQSVVYIEKFAIIHILLLCRDNKKKKKLTF